jgi:uncharacterized protein YdeI (YjbR/CyaY-like superfamily)
MSVSAILYRLQNAKRAATRQRRLATALEWLAEGKGRNWKYQSR